MRKSRETEVRIVLTQKNAILCAGGKHAVRLIHTLIDKIVNENANIGLVPAKHQSVFLLQPQMGIHTRHNALGGRFLITGGTIHLTGQEEIFHHLGAQ